MLVADGWSLVYKVGMAVKREHAADRDAVDLQAINRVLGDPRRFEILRHIAAGQCVGCSALRTQFPITAATLSHHLKELEAVGLIDTTKNGKFVDVTFRRAAWERYLNELSKM